MSQILKPKKGYKLVKWLFGKEIEIPKYWVSVKLIEKCDNKPEYGAGVSAIEKNLQLPRYVRITDLNDDGSLRNFEWKSILEEDAKDYILNEGEILFARTGATVGKTYLHQKNNGRCAFAGYLIRFKPNIKNLDPKFLFHLTHSKLYWIWLLSIQTWGVQPNVNAEQYSSMPILLPLLSEQQKIATILSNVYNLITTTQKVIYQTKYLKQGLMQKLLTKGIGHRKFKKVKWLFGEEIEIPEEWKIKKLETLVDILDSERIPIEVSEREKRHGKYPYYGASGIIDYFDDYIFDERLLCLAEDGENLRSKVLPIAFTIENKTWVNNHAHVLRVKESTEHFFLEYFLNNLSLLKYVVSTAIPKLNQKDMRSIQIICPEILEQQKISDILSNVDSQIQSQIQYKEKLDRLKKSLMQKLLTGEVRVKV